TPYWCVGIGQCTLYQRPPRGDLWCYAQRPRPQEQNLVLDINIFDADGTKVASISDCQLQQVNLQTSLDTQEWRDWLYTVTWQPQAIRGLPPNYLPTPQQLSTHMEPEFTSLLTQAPLEAYGHIFNDLERLGLAYILATLEALGLSFR